MSGERILDTGLERTAIPRIYASASIYARPMEGQGKPHDDYFIEILQYNPNHIHFQIIYTLSQSVSHLPHQSRK